MKEMGKNKLLILAIPIASSLTTEHFSLSFIRAKWESSVMHRDARSFGIDDLQRRVHDAFWEDGRCEFEVRADKSNTTYRQRVVGGQVERNWVFGGEALSHPLQRHHQRGRRLRVPHPPSRQAPGGSVLPAASHSAVQRSVPLRPHFRYVLHIAHHEQRCSSTSSGRKRRRTS